jgi:hypothetical protein
VVKESAAPPLNINRLPFFASAIPTATITMIAPRIPVRKAVAKMFFGMTTVMVLQVGFVRTVTTVTIKTLR